MHIERYEELVLITFASINLELTDHLQRAIDSLHGLQHFPLDPRRLAPYSEPFNRFEE